MSENGEMYTAGKIFTLPPGVTGVTNSNSDCTTPSRVTTDQFKSVFPLENLQIAFLVRPKYPEGLLMADHLTSVHFTR